MATPLTPTDIIAWFRAKAAEFTNIADQLERTFAMVSGISGVSVPRTYQPLTKDAIHARLAHKSARIASLAEEFGVSEKEIELFISDPVNQLIMGERGWVKPYLDPQHDS